MTTVYGVLGYPIAHSLSPAMHNAAFRALGMDASYVPFEVTPYALAEAVRGIVALGVAGANVTVPHKNAVMGYLDELDDRARALGAVNTIVNDDDTLLGLNTDVEGFARSLEEAGVEIGGTRSLVLGAGGAARAAVAALLDRGAESVIVSARRLEEAERVAAELGSLGGSKLHASAIGEHWDGVTLLVQATSATMGSEAEEFAQWLPWRALDRSATVVDLVYAPRRTTVLEQAEARGLRTVEGAGMLIHQGALAFHRWTGREAPIEVMRRAVHEALDARSPLEADHD
jgi:shikimate dehydrogenase